MKEHGAYTEEEAASYEADRAVEPLWHIENAYIRDLVMRRCDVSILDVPIGTGRFLEFYGDRKVSGVDLSQSMLDMAQERAAYLGIRDITLMKGSVVQLPFSDGEFDLVVCWRLLHLLPPESLAPALISMARVCRGTLCVQVYERATFLRRVVAKTVRWVRRIGLIAARKRKLTPWSHIYAYSHTRQDVESAAQAAGLGLPTICDNLGSYEGTNVIVLQWIRE